MVKKSMQDFTGKGLMASFVLPCLRDSGMHVATRGKDEIQVGSSR